MKMYSIMLLIILLFNLFSLPQQNVSDSHMNADDFNIIPDEAIRLRILAHSDDETDQQVKHLVRDAVNEELTDWVEHLTDIDDARALIKARIQEIDAIVGSVLAETGIDLPYQVEYRSNVTFPAKIYDMYVYPPGEYEAILITIGSGLGSNWWCVLFPPLCFLDFSYGTTVASDDQSTEQLNEESNAHEEQSLQIKFFLFEWLGWS